MKTEVIEKLLESYFNGETSSKEEKILGNYFNSGKVDSKLEQYKVIFRYFATEKKSMKILKKEEWLSISEKCHYHWLRLLQRPYCL
jgi:hypothetical protein